MNDTIFWGGLHLPASCGSQHFCIIGAPGSGKSISLQLLMKSVLPGIKPGSNRRALIYDAKRDIYATLVAMGIPKSSMSILNPFDRRSVAWNMAADITDPATAIEIGTLLVPEKDELQPFFPEAARSLISGTMEAFLSLAPGEWTLRDVVLALRFPRRYRKILKFCSETRHLVETYLDESEMQRSVSATIANTMRRLALVAAAWERTAESISLSQWVRSEHILLLGRNPKLNSTIQQLNAAILHRLTQLILSEDEATTKTPRPQTWIFIDELRQAGKFTNLPGFMVECRSKGGCVVLGFQDFPGLMEVYGEKLAREVVGGASNKAFLWIEESETAKFASEHMGTFDVDVTRYTQNWSVQSSWPHMGKNETYMHGYSRSTHRESRPLVLPSEFRAIKPPTPTTGISGYYDTASIGSPYFATLPGDFVASELVNPAPGVLNMDPRPADDQLITEWSVKDLDRLGLRQFPELLLRDDESGGGSSGLASKLPQAKMK